MNYREQYTQSPATPAQLCRLWSAHVDALDRHLSPDRWALAAITVALIGYPIAPIMIPALVHHIVPNVVRTVLNLI